MNLTEDELILSLLSAQDVLEHSSFPRSLHSWARVCECVWVHVRAKWGGHFLMSSSCCLR
jgi:hypothetical protein